MNLNQLVVVHKTFGDGTVIEQNGKYFRVHFSVGDKTFVYPDAFEKFLTLTESEKNLEEEILADLSKAKAIKQEIANKKQEENEVAMKRGIVIPGKDMSLTEGDEEDKSSSESEE